MPEFHLDTSGVAALPLYEGWRQYTRWSDLDDFTQGYVTALFIGLGL